MLNNKQLIYTVVGIILINIIGTIFYKRFDLTQDQRYTLSNSAKKTIANVDSPIFIDVFLHSISKSNKQLKVL